jgi:hypothetical protein
VEHEGSGCGSYHNLGSHDVLTDIGRRLPQAKGFEKKLAKPAGDVEMLIGMKVKGECPGMWRAARSRGTTFD